MNTIFNFKINSIIIVLFSLFMLSLQIDAQEVDGKSALKLLKEGNERYVENKMSLSDLTKEREKLTSTQKPYAIILSCSDSRVPPEIIFNESLGKLFVIRVAGNVLSGDEMGSIEYAAEHLHTRLLLILGHQSCGAVGAAAAGRLMDNHIDSIIVKILPAVDMVNKKDPSLKGKMDRIIKQNVLNQMKIIVDKSHVIKELVEKKRLLIEGGVYNLHTGKVEFFENH